MKITPKDREEFPHHTDNAIIGIKIIRRISSEKLQKLLHDPKGFEKLRLKIGNETNPRWVTGVIAEVLYDRNDIDENCLDRLMS